MTFTWVDATCEINGQTCWAYTRSNHEIEFYARYWANIKVPILNRRGIQIGTEIQRTAVSSPAISPQLAIHELGHAFDALAGNQPRNYVATYTGTANSSLLFRDQGLTDGFFAGNFTGQISKDLGSEEIFADMFLNWVYGKWGAGDLGTDRQNVMTTKMSEWLSP